MSTNCYDMIKVTEVFPFDNLRLLLVFSNGEIKELDMTRYLELYSWLTDKKKFALAKVELNGDVIMWKSYLTITADDAYEESEYVDSKRQLVHEISIIDEMAGDIRIALLDRKRKAVVYNYLHEE